MNKLMVVAGVLLLFSIRASALPIPVVPYTGEGTPVAGANIVATGGDVIATYVSGGGAYDDYLYLASPSNTHTNAISTNIGPNWIFSNRTSSSGDTVNLGNFAPGTVLTFNILANTHQGDFSQNASGYLNWYSGPASLNADGMPHAIVDASYTGPYGGTFVGFEDCFPCGGAAYFEDLRYTFSNTTIPEPATIALFGIGLAGLGFSRRRKRV